MGRRIRLLLIEAWHLVLGVVVVGLVVAGVAALVGHWVGKHGGHEVLTVVIAVGAVGLASFLLAGLIDPAPAPGPRGQRIPGFLFRPRYPRRSYLVGYTADADDLSRQCRRDDVLYAGGVLLMGLAVLLGYICSWEGVPPANPFHG